MSKFKHCGRGVCAAEAGHKGTCAQASGWDEAGDQARERLERQFELLIREVKADAYAQALDDLNGEGYLDTEAHEMYATFHNPYRRF